MCSQKFLKILTKFENIQNNIGKEFQGVTYLMKIIVEEIEEFSYYDFNRHMIYDEILKDI